MIFKEDYQKKDVSGYGSHIEPLLFLFENIIINKAVEYGMGFFSTPLLLDYVKISLLSIEMQSKEWYDNVVERYSTYTNKWYHCYSEKVTSFLGYPDCDLILIDGSSITRSIGVAYAMQRGIENIVLHDTDSTWYGYHLIDEYRDKHVYIQLDFTENAPHTRIYTKNKKLIDAYKSKYNHS